MVRIVGIFATLMYIAFNTNLVIFLIQLSSSEILDHVLIS